MQDVLEFAEAKSAERLDKQQNRDECPPVAVGEMVNLHHHPPVRHEIEIARAATSTGEQYK